MSVILIFIITIMTAV